MTLAETLVEVWRQSLGERRDVVEIDAQRYPVTRTRAKGLRVVSFAREGRRFEGIEQNPETKSRWAALARDGKKIMQFRYGGQYIGNVCEGTLLRYPRWTSAGLGD